MHRAAGTLYGTAWRLLGRAGLIADYTRLHRTGWGEHFRSRLEASEHLDMELGCFGEFWRSDGAWTVDVPDILATNPYSSPYDESFDVSEG
ncbi:hypothetical protein AVEN_62252-1 [Araneus ventricosus]|uniref:Uncharacterized protein n=1 Tax=Araneus ventricosus TaxID=182803 RepID=A0A4Y2ECC7_ARAVE|nr:hypothetical protein AVEN_62252-1 [Araneus ventricosus]